MIYAISNKFMQLYVLQQKNSQSLQLHQSFAERVAILSAKLCIMNERQAETT